MHIYDPIIGSSITQAVSTLIELATRDEAPWTMTFNGIVVTAQPGDAPQTLVAAWEADQARHAAAYAASPEAQAARLDAATRDAQRRAALAEALVDAPAVLSLRDPEGWQQAIAANQDAYGAAVLTYAARWARLMEGALAHGTPLEACAEALSHLADEEGVTGFMVGCAVSILAQTWAYGEALRRWHNLATQVRDEGVRANATGGVLNPAILVLGPPDATAEEAT